MNTTTHNTATSTEPTDNNVADTLQCWKLIMAWMGFKNVAVAMFCVNYGLCRSQVPVTKQTEND